MWKTLKELGNNNNNNNGNNNNDKQLNPDLITEAKGDTILWDFAIRNDRKIKSNRKEIAVKDNKRKKK